MNAFHNFFKYDYKKYHVNFLHVENTDLYASKMKWSHTYKYICERDAVHACSKKWPLSNDLISQMSQR
jgi:hypothetical protein